jgi:hypothetical protein
MSLPRTDLQHNTTLDKIDPKLLAERHALRDSGDGPEFLSSTVVRGFHCVETAAGMAFPCCGRQITPQCATFDDGTIRTICPHCHVVAQGFVPDLGNE